MTAADELVDVLLRELEDLGDLRNREQPIRLRWCFSEHGPRDQGRLKIGRKACCASRPVCEHRSRQRVGKG
jgi:hypothetical protein